MGGEPVVARLKTPAAGQDVKAEKEMVA
jgi:hypothetical protein